MATQRTINESLFINKNQTSPVSNFSFAKAKPQTQDSPLFINAQTTSPILNKPTGKLTFNNTGNLLQKVIPSRTFTVQNYQPAEFTVYTARKAETDLRPKEMASGKKVYEGAIATSDMNMPMGTKVYVPELGKTYIVEDRLGPRIRKITEETGKQFFDIYHNDLKKAKEFGRQNLTFKILK